MECTNTDLGAALDLSPSSVSRMRSGIRTGSPETLKKLSIASGVPVADVLDAAIEARAGNPGKWVEVVEKACTPNGA